MNFYLDVFAYKRPHNTPTWPCRPDREDQNNIENTWKNCFVFEASLSTPAKLWPSLLSCTNFPFHQFFSTLLIVCWISLSHGLLALGRVSLFTRVVSYRGRKTRLFFRTTSIVTLLLFIRSPVVDLLLNEVNWALTRPKSEVKHASVVLHANAFLTLWATSLRSKLARPKNSPGSKTSNAQCLTRHLRVRHCENPSPLRSPVLIQYWKPLLKEIFFIFFLCCAHAWLFQSTLEYGDHHLFRFSLV